jgi:hypothetical protein
MSGIYSDGDNGADGFYEMPPAGRGWKKISKSKVDKRHSNIRGYNSKFDAFSGY